MSLFGRRKQDDETASEAVMEVAKAPAPPPEKPKKPYGIEQLIVLMRKLPADNIDLVVRVLKETLESVLIPLPGLIKEAEEREADLTAGIADHRRSIAALETELAATKKAVEEEIASKQKAIGNLETSQKEVTLVKERLNRGLKLDQVTVVPVAPPPPPRPSIPAAAPPPLAETKPRAAESKPLVSDPQGRSP